MKFYKPKDLINLLKKLKTFPKKKFSQNFLIDKNIIDKIIKISSIKKNDTILEIGPGPGALTQEIIKTNHVIAIEKDKTFANHIKSLNVELYEDDFLHFPLEKILKKNQKIIVISNIPYHIASSIITKLLKYYPYIKKIILMLQYEFAKRLIASKGEKNYSSFSIFVNFYTKPKIEFKVSKNSFFPKPSITSCIVSLKIKKNIPNIDKEKFHRFVQNAFCQRRKKISNFLKKYYPNFKLKKNLENLRPENLSLKDFQDIFKKIEESAK